MVKRMEMPVAIQPLVLRIAIPMPIVTTIQPTTHREPHR